MFFSRLGVSFSYRPDAQTTLPTNLSSTTAPMQKPPSLLLDRYPFTISHFFLFYHYSDNGHKSDHPTGQRRSFRSDPRSWSFVVISCLSLLFVRWAARIANKQISCTNGKNYRRTAPGTFFFPSPKVVPMPLGGRESCAPCVFVLRR